MNKASHDQYTSVLSDSISIIRGNAQLALEVDRPKWVDRYLQEIIKEIDKVFELLNQTKDSYQSECFSASVTSGALRKKTKTKYVTRGVQNE